MKSRLTLVAGVLLSSTSVLLADFQYEQTTRITGGFLAGMARLGGRAGQPTTATVAVKGNRMVHLTGNTASITDLDKETITNVDFDKKTYSVMTFQEMKEMIERASERMHGKNDDANMTFTASVKETGKKQAVKGLSANEFILIMAVQGTDAKSGQSGAINITNDMWMAPEVPGYQEVRDFQKRMAEKLGSTFAGANPMMGMRPGMGKGLAEMAKEMSKLKCIPVMQVMRMGSTPDGKPLPSASEAPELSQQSQPDVGAAAGRSASDAAIGSALGRLGGVGGLGGFGRKKKQDQDQPQPQQQAKGGGAGAGMLMETTTEMGSFSSAPVDASKFDVPAGFKQVERRR